MYKIQYQRLVNNFALNLNSVKAALIIARAYGRETYDPLTDAFGAKMPGYQDIREPKAILEEDPQNQMMDFVRMGLNIGLSRPDVREGISEKTLVAVMWGFSNFDALVAYVESDPVDASSKDLDMLAKFKRRYGYPAFIQILLGRDYAGNTLIIQPNAELASRFIDQELGVNPKDGTRVAVVRTRKDGDAWLNQYLDRTMKVYRGQLVENLSSVLLGSADKDTDTFLSLLPERAYTLSSLVTAHMNALTSGSPAGRTLIVDGVTLDVSAEDLDHAFTLARKYKINIVVVQSQPDVVMWPRFESRLVFDFNRAMAPTNTAIDGVLLQAARFVGYSEGILQYVYHSEAAGVRFSTMDLLPQENKARNVLSAIFSRKRG